MEELHKVALAYYERATEEEKQSAIQLFQAMDADGNGRVTLLEFLEVFDREVSASLLIKWFKILDRNNDGTLDFDEVCTLYFTVKSENFCACDICGESLVKIYFSCLDCHVKPGDTFDLCVDCYRRGSFNHRHKTFYDNLSLLKMYRELTASQSPTVVKVQPKQTTTSQSSGTKPTRSKSVKVSDGVSAFNTAFSLGQNAVTIGTAAASVCSIM